MPRGRQERPDSVRAEGARIPVSSQRSPLLYRGLDTDNYFHRWVLDKDDRIAKYLEGGYEFVKPTQDAVGEKTIEQQSQALTGSRVTKSAGFGGFKLVLMRIPLEWYLKDQAVKQKEIDEIEETMRPARSGNAGVDYGTVSFSRSRKPFGDVEVTKS